MPFMQLIYCSRPRLPEEERPQTLASIMDAASRRNSIDEITGCLGHSRDWFLQVIEGPEAAVAQTYIRIGRDTRHSDVRTLLTREIRNRSFPEWSMASVSLYEAASFGSVSTFTGSALSPETTPPLQLLMWLMNAADTMRMKR
jgi:Sensors of blue-light using FAD